MTKRSENKARTRALVLEVAKAAFDTLGYEGADIRTIAATMGMSTGAVFSNFASKADIYREIYGHWPISPEAARQLRDVLKRLAFAARTSGGTPGPDKGLMAACDDAEALLAKAA